MMKFVTCGQMKILEKRADAAGLSYYQMMENAGTAAFEKICEAYGREISGTKAILFCGKGNNGGDGFVVARKLKEAGSDTTIVLVDGNPASEDAITNFNRLDPDVPIIDTVSYTHLDVYKRQYVPVDHNRNSVNRRSDKGSRHSRDIKTSHLGKNCQNILSAAFF